MGKGGSDMDKASFIFYPPLRPTFNFSTSVMKWQRIEKDLEG